MNWEALGAIGEILGAITVIATLFYLGKQIRQNSASLDRANDYAQANSVHAINSMYIQVFGPLAQNTELAQTYSKALDGSDLDPIEAVRFGAFVNTFLAWLENMYFQQHHDLGFSTEDQNSIDQICGPYVRSLLNTSSGLDWWKTEGLHLYTREFVEFVENLRGLPD